MKTLFLIIISTSVLFASVGKITSLKGEVYIDRNNQKIFAKVGSILEIKDHIITKKNSKAILLFNDNMSITVGKNSTLQVQKYIFDTNVVANNKATLRFGKGLFRTITGKLGKLNPSGLTIKTSTTTIGIRGSDGVTRVFDDGSVSHTTYSGGFILKNNITGRTVWVPRGTTGRVDKNKIGVLPTLKKTNEENADVVGSNEDPLIEKNSTPTSNDDLEEGTSAATDARDESDDSIDSSLNVENLTQTQLDEYITKDSFTLSNDYLTPISTINNYATTATYSGNINGINTETDGTTSTDTGTITLNINFGNSSFTGSASGLSVGYTTIGSGNIINNTFSSTVFSTEGGSINGKFYGDNAGVVGGTLSIETAQSKKFSGSFGAIKDTAQD